MARGLQGKDCDGGPGLGLADVADRQIRQVESQAGSHQPWHLYQCRQRGTSRLEHQLDCANGLHIGPDLGAGGADRFVKAVQGRAGALRDVLWPC
jgi:hypothetical protein